MIGDAQWQSRYGANGYASLAEPDPAVHFAHLPCNAAWIAEIGVDVDLACLGQQFRAGQGEIGSDPNLL